MANRLRKRLKPETDAASRPKIDHQLVKDGRTAEGERLSLLPNESKPTSQLISKLHLSHVAVPSRAVASTRSARTLGSDRSIPAMERDRAYHQRGITGTTTHLNRVDVLSCS